MVRLSKITKGLLAVLLIAGSLVLTGQLTNQSAMEVAVPTAYAANGDAATTGTTTEKEAFDPEKLLDTVARLSTYTNRIFNPGIFFFANHIGGLLNNDYIFAGEMGTMLKSIWVASRNIVNIVFVLILLFLAVRHIFGSDDNTDLKKALPKFVVVLIAVNFSWLAGKVVLDAANIATNVVFQLPAGVQGIAGESVAPTPCEIIQTGADTTDTKGDCRPTRMAVSPKATSTLNFISSECPHAQIDAAVDLNINDKNIFCWDTMDISQMKQNNASMYLTYSIARVQKLVKGTTREASDITIGSIFAFVIQLVYLIAFACLFMALVIRVAALWILMAFSPFLVLIYYLKDINVSIENDTLSVNSFIHWAFVPTKVAAVFSVGFLMLYSGQKASGLLQRLNDNEGVRNQLIDPESLFMGMSDIQQFIWLLMTTMIVWIGTFAVLTKLKAGSAIFEKINGYGKSIATEVAKSPTWAPVMPMVDPKTGQLRLGSYAKEYGSLDPLKAMRAYRQEVVGEKTVDRYQKGVEKFKGDTQLRSKLINMAQDATDSEHKRLAEWFHKETGIHYNDMTVDNGETLRKALTDIGGGVEKHADAILQGAKILEKGLATKTPEAQ